MLAASLLWVLYLGKTMVIGFESQSWNSYKGKVISSNISKVEGKKDRYRLYVKYTIRKLFESSFIPTQPSFE